MNFTAVISAWRAGKYIRQCLEGFRHVEGVDEILLGVDGCADTLAVIEDGNPAKGMTRLFYAEQNGGNYLMYNTLIPMAKNDSFLIFGADDIPLPALGEQFAELNETCDIILHCFSCLNESGTLIKVPPNLHPAGGVMITTKRVHEELGGYCAWRCAADTDYKQRARRAGLTSDYRKKPMFLRRSRGDSLIRSPETGRGSALRNEYVEHIERHRALNITKAANLKGVIYEI